ncbi:MAG: sulfatase [bacterium]
MKQDHLDRHPGVTNRATPSRRDFLQLLGTGALSLSLGGLAGCGQTSRRRPNIVFILTDDHRFDAMGNAGHPWLSTPNLDRLSTDGVRFTNAFVTTSLCSPSRASFLTGCYAHTHGVVANELNDPPPSLPTFPRQLHQAGYETAFIGKWHQARKSTPRPGFDHWVSFNGQGHYNRNTFNVDGEWVLSRNYITDELTAYAERFLRRDRERPFLLCLSHKAVHTPVRPAPRHRDYFRDERVFSQDRPGDELDSKPDWGGRRREFSNWSHYIRDYMRCLVGVDESVGTILDCLAEQQLLDDTVVVYAGDNGYLHGEHGGLWDKRAAYDPSIRIPLLMRYPRLVNPGSVCRELVLNIDLAPTMLQVAGVSTPEYMQGQSWLDQLAGQPGRSSFLYEYFQEQGAVPTVLAVRDRRWKYVTYPRPETLGPDEPWHTDELYDLLNDTHELHNRISDPELHSTVNQLQRELTRLRAETDYPVPSAGLNG